MTVENLHDAIGLLPSDLIAKVDEKRSRKRTVIPFRRYAAIVACALLVLGSSFLLKHIASGGAKETAMAAPEMMQAADESNRFDAPAAAAPKYEETGTEPAMGEPEAPVEDNAVCGYPTLETFHADEIPPEGIAEEPFEPEYLSITDIQYALTQNIGTGATTSEPMIRVVRSAAELEALRQKLGYYTMENFDACVIRYDDAWFENHDLLVVLVKALYTGSTLTLDSVYDSDGSWCVKFYSSGTDTGQREDRFVFAALEKGRIPEENKLFAMFEVP